ncbi:TRAP transporter small permease [Cryobacterium sp. Y62]|uniref:TRAP transporter small permease n=1 Tax=Cryobacterium sp. Y62 TaxID=2048284 RepID=UPI000CE2F1F3|nr:TRAP transporter small permease [Cryobacterium sp. Y62]
MNSTKRLIPPVADLSKRGVFAITDLIICWAVIVGICGLTGSLLYQVFSRYVLNNPTIWSEELAILLFVWVSMLAISLGFRRGEHLAIDMFSRHLPALGVKLLATLVSLLSCIALSVIGYYAFQIIPSVSRQVLPGISGGLGLPAKVSWMYFPVIIGCVLSIFFILERLFAVWAGRVLVLNADADVLVIEQLENDLSLPVQEAPLEAGVSKANAEAAWVRDDVSTSTFLTDNHKKFRS